MSHSTDSSLTELLNSKSETPLFPEFRALFMRSMSSKSLETYSSVELAEFLEARLAYFTQSVLRAGDFRITQGEGRALGKHLIEIVYPTGSYSMITMESLLTSLNLRVTRKLYPMLSVEIKDAVIQSIAAALPDTSIFDYIYIEIEAIEQQELLDQLKPLIQMHIQAVQSFSADQETILSLLNNIKKQIESTQNLQLAEPKEEWLNLIDWLRQPNFSFFGYVAYSGSCACDPNISLKQSGDDFLCCMEDSGLGILSPRYLKQDQKRLQDVLAAHVWKHSQNQASFVLDQLRVTSPIQHFKPLMRLSLKLPDESGTGIVEHVFVGLLKRNSLHVKNTETPLIHLKLENIFKEKFFLPNSYEHNEVLRIFRTIPKFELFRTPASDLLQMVEALMSINNPSRIHCFQFPLDSTSGSHARLKLLVVLPPKLYTPENLKKVISHLKQEIPHQECDWVQASGIEKCRLHVYFELQEAQMWKLDISLLEEQISDLIKPWEERLRDILVEHFPAMGTQLYDRYVPMMPQHYKVRVSCEEAATDIHYLECLVHEEGIQFNLKHFNKALTQTKASLLYVYSKEKINLIHIMPLLQNMGLFVIDQLTARIGNREVTQGYIHSFRVTENNGNAVDENKHKALLGEVLSEVFKGRTENDALNALALKADLNWRAINVLQMYRNLYLQLNTPFSRGLINEALLKYPHIARLLFEVFETRFSPKQAFGSSEYRNTVLHPQKKQEFIDTLQYVTEVSDDAILRHLFDLMEHTLRTNFYIPKSSLETFISIKLDSKKLKQMPAPAPYCEIYVHDVNMEGTHLRFGPVARGGLRWSDRPDDFRTEILGLVKTQQTKNVVIVPVGSKGGFIIKNIPSDRQGAAAESQKQYRRFISALLDLTDNVMLNGQMRHPEHVLAYDALDPYLVVAADKGTATFSDIANSVSERYGHWLGDAFASGGSVGYDHKKEGITARGAWECVQLHFREMGRDIQSELTTVSGIGDMAGDVFGNGMLLSKMLQLRAAFNHVHIFLDPNPDPLKSWQERKRLFETPRSTWKDYSSDLISQGGGVYDRKAKEIRLSPEAQTMLDVDSEIVTGNELIRCILKMQTDLFWFGGIGTYIKAPYQTHLHVGDHANDAIRIDTDECRALVIGEGANLGLTQLARMEYDKSGGRINTDAIDNSAGVNMSDYEVNLKILLQQLLRSQEVSSMEERNRILAEATDEVSELVLQNNRAQHRLLSMESIRSLSQFKVFRSLIGTLRERGLSVRNEYIPTRSDQDQLEISGVAMPRPVLAVLQAYTKMYVYDTLLQSSLDFELFLDYLHEYIPQSILKRFQNSINQHQLKREIIATVLTNKIVNQAGCNFFPRSEQLTNKDIAEIAETYLLFDLSLQGKAFRKSILNAEGVKEEDRYAALIEFENLLQILVHNALQRSQMPLTLNKVSIYEPLLQELHSEMRNHCHSENQDAGLLWRNKGFEDSIASTLGIIENMHLAPDILYLHEQESMSLKEAQHLASEIERLFGFAWIQDNLLQVELHTEWDLAHQDILQQNLDSSKLRLLRFLAQQHESTEVSSLDESTLLAPLYAQFTLPLGVYFQTLEQLKTGTTVNLTTLAVGINGLNFLNQAV